MKIAPLAEVKAKFSSYIQQTREGPVIVTKNGKPVAVLLGVEENDDLERIILANSPRLQALLDAAEERIQAGQGLEHEAFWEAVAKEMDDADGEKR